MTYAADASFQDVMKFLDQLDSNGLTAELMQEVTENPRLAFAWIEWLENVTYGMKVGNVENVLISNAFAENSARNSRVRNTLKRYGCETLEDLIDWSFDELKGIPNFGQKSISTVENTLASYGLSLSNHKPGDPNRVPLVGLSDTRTWPFLKVQRWVLTSRIGSYPLEWAMEIGNPRRVFKQSVRVSDAQTMSDDELSRLYTAELIPFIREWISKHVW